MPCDPFSVPVHSYLPHTHSLCLSDYLMCTHVHTKGSYQAAVCLKCCFYIAVIFHFGLLSLNCLWGFVWGEEPSHLYMRQKGEETEVRECLCSYSFSLSSFLFEYGACFSTLCFISFTLLSIRFFYVLKHISVSLPLSLTADPQPWHASEV